MTGGTARAEEINLTLARGAQSEGVAMGLGSIRAAVEDEESWPGLFRSAGLPLTSCCLPISAPSNSTTATRWTNVGGQWK